MRVFALLSILSSLIASSSAFGRFAGNVALGFNFFLPPIAIPPSLSEPSLETKNGYF